MATYDSPRGTVESNLQASVGSFLAQRILAALDQQNPGGGAIQVQTDWTPTTAVAPGTDILLAAPGSISGEVVVPDGIAALLLTGATGVQASFNATSDVILGLTSGSDVVTIDTMSTMAARMSAMSDDEGMTITTDLGAGDDVFVGAQNASNIVIGGEGDDDITGGLLNDVFYVGEGSDTVKAGDGFDVAYVKGNLSDYTTSFENGVLTLVDSTGATTTLTDLEYAQFEDGGVIINVTTELGFGSASLYEVILDRPADPYGLEYFSERSGEELIQAANDMLYSQEFTQKFGDVAQMTDEQFLDVVYEAAFDRAPDADGREYWLEQLAGGMSKGELALGFAFSAEAHETFDGMINFQQS